MGLALKMCQCAHNPIITPLMSGSERRQAQFDISLLGEESSRMNDPKALNRACMWVAGLANKPPPLRRTSQESWDPVLLIIYNRFPLLIAVIIIIYHRFETSSGFYIHEHYCTLHSPFLSVLITRCSFSKVFLCLRVVVNPQIPQSQWLTV